MTGVAHDWSAREGEPYMAAKARVDAVGLAVVEMIHELALDVFDLTGMVDNSIPVLIGYIDIDREYGTPHVAVMADDGAEVLVHAARVSLRSDVPISMLATYPDREG